MIVLASILQAGFPARSVAADEAAVPTSPAPPLAITVDQGLVSVDVHDALLADVLRSVSEQAAVQVTMRGGDRDRVTESFDDVALDEAIKRLARGHDVVLIYRSRKGRTGTGGLVEALVYEASLPSAPAVIDPKQRTARLQAVRKLIQEARRRQPGAFDSLTGILATEPDPVVRRTAAAGVASIRGPEAVAALTTALGDQDPSVRAAVVSSLGSMRDETVAPAVAQILARDPVAAVRRAAVWALAALRSDDAHRGLQVAVSDADASVRRSAVSALNRWERRARASSR
jgi:HEAT repeat protein